MATVFIDQKYADIVNELSMHKTSFSGKGKSIFDTNMQLMIMAAMIGYSVDSDEDLEPVAAKGNEIGDHVFKNRNMDGVAYLMALHKTQDGDVLREKNENEVWKIFETYANRGFEEMNTWFTLDGVSDPEHVETLLTKMKEIASKSTIQGEGVFLDKTEF
jgi:dnd system-associated protein 4